MVATKKRPGRRSKDDAGPFCRRLGEAIKARRAELGVSLEQVARKTDGAVSGRSVNYYEEGQEPGIEKFILLCFALGVRPESLIPPEVTAALRRRKTTLEELTAAMSGEGET